MSQLLLQKPLNLLRREKELLEARIDLLYSIVHSDFMTQNLKNQKSALVTLLSYISKLHEKLNLIYKKLSRRR